MKKRDFLFTGLLLMAAPMLAQELVPDGPTRTKEDAKVIFEQGFESDWTKFQNDTIDKIDTLFYYKYNGGSNQSIGSDIISNGVIARTDSVIYLKNGVKPTDNQKDVDAGSFSLDEYMTIKDQDNVRNDELMNNFGIDGGDYYFRYNAGHKIKDLEGNNSYTNGVTVNYRRNLFVRGIPVKENSSYRLTLYLKVNQPLKTDVVPTFFADVMKGYFHSEKPFYAGSTSSNGYQTTYNSFEYKKTEFTGNWEKVTFMTYYLNDSVQEIPYNGAYYWVNDWTWYPEKSGQKIEGIDSVNYIKQPDKFFVRLSFASDSTEFLVDNISLTKSWIGGVEYYSNKIRVDFGYETNLKDLANAQVATTNIDAIELPGKYFTVLGHYTDSIKVEDSGWYNIPINSAEYHGDGYMYMWTKDDEEGYPITFDYYDTVLVSFINPVDSAELALKYTNSSIYPKATDTEWAKTKFVPNFYNELATPNPYVFDGVYSMKNLPPVVQKLQYENGSFQLPASTSSISFTFSREVVCEAGATAETEHSALLKVVGNGKTEFWLPDGQSHDGDSTVVFVRPQSAIAANGDLDGDYEFQLSQICGYGTDDAKPVTYNYSFGNINVPVEKVNVTFDKFEEEATFTKGVSVNVAELGFSGKIATKIKTFPGKYGKALMFGNYTQAPAGASGSEKTCMDLVYTFTADETGDALVEFGWTGCLKNSWNDDCVINVVLKDMEDNELGRVQYGSSGYKPEEGAIVYDVATGNISGAVEAGKQYQFIIYLINESGDNALHLGGLVLYYLNIKYGKMGLGTPYLLKFDAAYNSLTSTLAIAAENEVNYSGAVFNASSLVQKNYANFKAEKETRPSRWNAVTDSLKAANSSLASRMSVVDAMWAAWEAADAKCTETKDADAQFAGNGAWKALSALLEEVDEFIPSGATDDSIKAVQKSIEDASKALDTRKALMSDFNSELARALAEIENKEAVVDIAEYAALQKIYAEFKDTNIYTTSDEDLTAARDAVKGATDAYVTQVTAMKVRAIRLKELAKEATAIGVVFDDSVATEYATRVKNATNEDLKLENVYKQAIKLAIYKKIAKSKSVENIDLTGFIRNFNLYVTAKIVDRESDKCPAPWDASDAPLKNTEGGLYNIMKVTHQYNNVPIWVVICENEITDLYPGWTVKSVYTGNSMVTPDDNSYGKFKAGQVIFDGQVAMDWNSRAQLSTVVEDLPAGLYQVGFNLKENTNDATKLTITADSISASTSCKNGASGQQFVDSVQVRNGSLNIDLNLQSGNGWSTADDFTLKFINKVDGFEYEAAIVAEEQKLSEMITFVDPFSADSKVEYIGLDGVKMNAPKAGQVSIKVTRKADGARVIEKVLVK